MSSPDYLYIARNNFYIGNYQTTIQEATKLTLVNENDQIERDCLIYRSNIALQNYSFVMEEIDARPTRTAIFSAIRILAEYYASPEKREDLIQQLGVLRNDEFSNSPIISVIAATIYNDQNNYELAYRTLRNPQTLEQMSIFTQTLLRMNRPDLANKIVKEMKLKDEDNVLTQLACCWVDVVLDGAHIVEASQIYMELIDKLGQSVSLLLGLGITYLKQGKGEEAYNTFLEAYERNPNDPDVLNNLIVCCQVIGKNEEETNKYITALSTSFPNFSTVVAMNQMKSRLQEIINKYKN
ncbi:hypothetical protein WA158_006067 [Blastocystis sp. Blastoise]